MTWCLGLLEPRKRNLHILARNRAGNKHYVAKNWTPTTITSTLKLFVVKNCQIIFCCQKTLHRRSFGSGISCEVNYLLMWFSPSVVWLSGRLCTGPAWWWSPSWPDPSWPPSLSSLLSSSLSSSLSSLTLPGALPRAQTPGTPAASLGLFRPGQFGKVFLFKGYKGSLL